LVQISPRIYVNEHTAPVESMSFLPGAIAGLGVVTGSVAVAAYVQLEEYTLWIGVTTAVSVVLLFVGLVKTSVPRGKAGFNVKKQGLLKAGTCFWADKKGEDGSTVSVYHGNKAYLALPLDPGAIRDPSGLVLSKGPGINTTYDFIFRVTEHDHRKALARCIRQHTFKDMVLPDGTPNPRPTVVDVPGVWEFLTYAEMKKQARALGFFMRKRLGVAQKEKVAIWSSNCVEWMLADLACAAFNFTSVAVYDTLGPDAASFIVADSGSQILMVEEKCMKRVPALLRDPVYVNNAAADLRAVVCFGQGDMNVQMSIEESGVKVFRCHAAIEEHRDDVGVDTPPVATDIVTIMYTSGTSGLPKGVMLQHQNVVSTISMIDLNPSLSLHKGDVHLSYLPLAHIFERQNVTGLLSRGALVYFASSGPKHLLQDLSVIKPTVFAGVPRVYEGLRDAVQRKVTGPSRLLLDAAVTAKVKDLDTGQGYSPLWDLLFFNRMRSVLGGRVRFCLTGGAPISRDTLNFVRCALGDVVQGYGCTETSAASTLTMTFDTITGHVGPPIGTCCIRLVDVPEMDYYSGPVSSYVDKSKAAFDEGRNKSGGEVWIGGPSVSKGYYDPSLHGLKSGVPSNGMGKKTAEEFFEEDGWSWFKTGDVGAWDERGCLRIVDRKANIFKTSLGEYVSVEEVEKTYLDHCSFVDFVFVPKETKVSYVSLCVVVCESIGSVMEWAKAKGVTGDEAAVVASAQFRSALFEQFEKAAKHNKLQRFMCVGKKNFHVEYQRAGYQDVWVTGVQCANGHKERLLTATYKARRAQLNQYFAPIFPKLYSDRPTDHILP